MYTLEQKQLSIDTYFELRSHRKTIRILGYSGSCNTLTQSFELYYFRNCGMNVYSLQNM